MSAGKHTPGRTHTAIDRARNQAKALRAIGVEPTVPRLMRTVRPLLRTEAEQVVREWHAAIAKATGAAA